MKFSTQLAGLAALLAALAMPSFAQAQKVGSANVQKVFSDIKETKDLETKLKASGEALNVQNQNAQKRLGDLKAQRDQFKAGSSEYDRANQELSRTLVQSNIEIQVAQQELQREQKRQTKNIFDKIVAAVAALAKEKQYTLVVAQIVPPEPSDDNFDRLTAEQLIGLLRQQNLLYVDPAADLTAEVVTRMDAAYAAPAR